jgi:hypothetical protein
LRDALAFGDVLDRMSRYLGECGIHKLNLSACMGDSDAICRLKRSLGQVGILNHFI